MPEPVFDMRPLFTVNELARFLGVSRGTIYRLIKDEQLPHVHAGQRIRFRPQDIDEWLERSRNGA